MKLRAILLRRDHALPWDRGRCTDQGNADARRRRRRCATTNEAAHPLVFLFPLLTFGTVTFAVVGYGGWRLRSRCHVAAAAGYFVLLTGFVVGVQFTAPDAAGAIDAVLVPLLLVNWLVGSAHVGWLELHLESRRFAAESTPPADPALLTARQRLARREQARALPSLPRSV